MKSYAILTALGGLVPIAAAQISGFDISGHQDTTDFAKAYSDGDRFVIIKVLTCPFRVSKEDLTSDPQNMLPKVQITRAGNSHRSTTEPPKLS